jgi:hypothetical protein
LLLSGLFASDSLACGSDWKLFRRIAQLLWFEQMIVWVWQKLMLFV